MTPQEEREFLGMFKEDLFPVGEHGMIDIAPEYQALFEKIIPTLPAKITLIPPIEYELRGYEPDQLHYTWQA